ncbi:hypothetical protein AKJ16_DCAP03756 [Drosera capensis]
MSVFLEVPGGRRERLGDHLLPIISAEERISTEMKTQLRFQIERPETEILMWIQYQGLRIDERASSVKEVSSSSTSCVGNGRDKGADGARS